MAGVHGEYGTQETRMMSISLLTYLRGRLAVVELRWGPRGPGPPERPGGPRETSVLIGFKGSCKRHPEIAR